ncbi:MAG: hypothetical protein COW34_10925 [Armatimonadetes bacterium CG17_big_fil_post_rev_8_21_14_2_50_66_6]|nr:MAG: hypothetical protein COW34_10925 [Armatimonadetes bacterium CG17_big_fil_post_rev_8_21_14_2_50_66_6]
MYLALGAALILVLAWAVPPCQAAEADELVTNPQFLTSEDRPLPAGWSVWEPEWAGAACVVRLVPGGLRMEAPGKPHAVGGVTQELTGVSGGRAYAVHADCELVGVPFPYRSALVRLEWTQGGKALHPAGTLVRGPLIDGDRARFDDTFVAPTEADGARLSLETKWLQGGSVTWSRVSLQPSEPPKPRKVKVGTVYLRPQNSTPERNLALWCAQIDSAGTLGLDIVCLGEAIRMVGTGASLADCSEPIPGPATRQLGEAARRNHLWVVAGLNECAGDTSYNTAVLLNREGELAGTYRKVHLPREEWRKGITPGSEYPVFSTDFGTLAVQICYDWFFSEPAAIFAQQGAEILFAPTWGNTLPDHDGMIDGESTFRVRARDNGLYLVPSVYDGNSLVIDPRGRLLASSNGKEGVVWAEIDLSVREPLEWVGHWRSIGPRDRMPETYGPLLGMPGARPH